MKLKNPLPKLSLIQDEVPEHVQEYMQLTRLAEVGRMAGVVAHEINNPLMVVQGVAENIEFMLDDAKLDKESVKKQLAEILKATERMANSVKKLQPKANDLKFYKVDLADIVKVALKPINDQLPELGVTCEIKNVQPMEVRCDVSQVEQMLLNVFSNAVKALQNIETGRELRISYEKISGWNQIKIWNNGPAIPDHARNKILRGGSALGLVVSKAIMEVHGGALSFTSDDVKGTEFVFSFPEAA